MHRCALATRHAEQFLLIWQNILRICVGNMDPNFRQHFGPSFDFLLLIRVGLFAPPPLSLCRRINSSHSLPSSHHCRRRHDVCSAINPHYCSCLYIAGLMRRWFFFYNSILYRRRHICVDLLLACRHNTQQRHYSTKRTQQMQHTSTHSPAHTRLGDMSCERTHKIRNFPTIA